MISTRIPTLGLLLLFFSSAATARAQGSVSGTVYDSLTTRAVLANATVVLVERNKYTTSDARGHFRIDSVPNGHYTLGFMHPILDSLDLTAPLVKVDVTGGQEAAVTLTTPSPAVAYAAICPGPRDSDTGVIIGHVRDVDDATSLANATISTEWTEFTVANGHSRGHRVSATAHTKADGTFLLCGAPTDVPLDVHTDAGGFIAGPTPLLPDERLLRRVDFAVSRKDSAAREVLLPDSLKPISSSPGTASLRGKVVGADGRPIREATVGIFGTPRAARTDANGAFRIPNIPAGTHTIEIKAIGLLPVTFSIDFATNAAKDTVLAISKQAQDLAAIAVKGKGSSTASVDNGGFDQRRANALGKFVTPEDLARRPSTNLADVLASFAGMKIEYGTGGYPLPMLKGVSSAKASATQIGSYCVPNFFLNGTHVYVDGALKPRGGTDVQPSHPFSDLSDSARPETIRGVEVYANPGTVPAQFDLMSSTGCGSIVIWTR